MPVYILDMLELPAEIKSAFEKGEFSIRQTSGSLNGIWSEMGTEKTSTFENNFWIDMTGYDFTRFAFQGCFGIHVFKCFQF
jgi:hypothetical protein